MKSEKPGRGLFALAARRLCEKLGVDPDAKVSNHPGGALAAFTGHEDVTVLEAFADTLTKFWEQEEERVAMQWALHSAGIWNTTPPDYDPPPSDLR